MPNFREGLNMNGGQQNPRLANESPYTLLNKLESQLGYFVDASAALHRIEQGSASTFERGLFSRSEFTPARFDEAVLRSERLCRIVTFQALRASVNSDPFDEAVLDEVNYTDIEDIFEKIEDHAQTRIAESVFDDKAIQRYDPEYILDSAYSYLDQGLAEQTLLHQIGLENLTDEYIEWGQGWQADLLALPMILRNAKGLYRKRVDQLELRYDGGRYNSSQENAVWEILIVMITIVLLGQGYIDQQAAIAVILGILAQLSGPNSIISIPETDRESNSEPTSLPSLLRANPRSWVAIFPEGTSEIDLFRDFDCWGSIRSLFRPDPSFIAIYEGGSKGRIEYFAHVDDVITTKDFSRYNQIQNRSCVTNHEKLLTITGQSKIAQPIISNGSFIRSPRGRFVRLGVFRAATQVSDLLNP